MSPSTRPSVVGSDQGPELPYPLKMEGKVISGFGRGSKELGIPTANLPVESSVTSWIEDKTSGVYFGWASLLLPDTHPDRPAGSPANTPLVFPMVMSIGYNPFYKNTVRSAEVHIMHKFAADFYGAHMRLLLLGFIRPELDYTTLEALIEDINFDCVVAKNSLRRKTWAPAKDAVVTAAGEGSVEGIMNVEWLTGPVPEAKPETKVE
ncbi:riboflavin kinase [Ceratocystis pirilliformis]|uniref:Riboflavin kinase n=1 Tax=Ceratocystis pirilliformis TaxID=259994 RepID=A0ABR3ZE39_9PEZI